MAVHALCSVGVIAALGSHEWLLRRAAAECLQAVALACGPTLVHLPAGGGGSPAKGAGGTACKLPHARAAVTRSALLCTVFNRRAVMVHGYT